MNVIFFLFILSTAALHQLVAAVTGNFVTDIFGCLSFTFLWFTHHQVQC